MYLREKRIRILKVKNVILVGVGLFFITTSVGVMVSLISHYHDDLKRVLEARATPDCVKDTIIGVIFFAHSGHIKAPDRGCKYLFSLF